MFDWKIEYSVQVPAIDTQHRELFRLTSELYAALAQGKGYTVVEQLLSSLVDYSNVHFTGEEQFMERYGFPRAAEHKKEHEQYREKISELQRRLAAGDTSLGLEVLIFLNDWLAHHIAGSDQQYSRYIRGKVAALDIIFQCNDPANPDCVASSRG